MRWEKVTKGIDDEESIDIENDIREIRQLLDE
jgi:hypothetical protein